MPEEILRETLDCGFKRCCPTVKMFSDGSMEISDDDSRIGSIGTIKISPEAVVRLRELIDQKK